MVLVNTDAISETIVVVVLYLLAIGITVYQSVTSDWDGRENLGTAIFLLGVAVVLFTENIIVIFDVELPVLLAWAEPIAAGVMIIGFLIARWSG